jgi:hypothetical protein
MDAEDAYADLVLLFWRCTTLEHRSTHIVEPMQCLLA